MPTADAPNLDGDLLSEAVRRVPAAAGGAPQLVFLADEEMKYVDVSDSVCELLGYSREELVHRLVTDVAVEETAPNEYREMIESGARVGRAKIRARDGRLFDFRYSAAEVLPLDGRRLFVSVGTVSADSEVGAHEQPGPERPLRLVVADDHQPTRLLVRTLLDFVDGVDVVGEAEDGIDAVALVMRLNPDVALLDIHMPRLDGIGAAETLRAVRPNTNIVLHTAQPDDDLRARAKQLGIPLLDKMRFDDVLGVFGADGRPPALSSLPDPRIEAAILTALAANGGRTPVLVIRADGTVPFYSLAAADLLGLPLPPRGATSEEILGRYTVLREDGSPLSDDERPLRRAVTERASIDEVAVIDRDGIRTPVRAVVEPFFDERGEFAGATLYYDPI